MNFLAHSYLSFSDQQIVGQFLQDFIPNRARFSYAKEIQKGIAMHRKIDTFTDAHPEVHEAKKIFSPLVRLYAGAFVDVAFDYFLARSLPEKVLQNHSRHVYSVLRRHYEILPSRLQHLLQYMEKDDWLYNYRNDWGIDFSMKNVLRKAKYLQEDIPVFEVYMDNKALLQKHFDAFFPQLEAHCTEINRMPDLDVT